MAFVRDRSGWQAHGAFLRTAEVVRKQSDGSWLDVVDNAFAEILEKNGLAFYIRYDFA